jgi:hypothetical protein
MKMNHRFKFIKAILKEKLFNNVFLVEEELKNILKKE